MGKGPIHIVSGSHTFCSFGHFTSSLSILAAHTHPHFTALLFKLWEWTCSHYELVAHALVLAMGMNTTKMETTLFTDPCLSTLSYCLLPFDRF